MTGYVLPVREIFFEAKRYGSITVLDVAQSLGLLDVDATQMNADVIAFAGHKTLYGPFGVGGFINVHDISLGVFISGGTGSNSLSLEMPQDGESRYEAASQNIVAIAGLNAALKCIDQTYNFNHEKDLTEYLIEGLSRIRKVKMYIPKHRETRIGIVSFCVQGYSSEEIGMLLSEDYEIEVRTGYHCAPYIHKYLDDKVTQGTVRIGIGKYNTKEEIDKFLAAIRELCE